MKKLAVACLVLLIGQIALADETPKDASAPKAERFVLATTASLDQQIVIGAGCKIVRRISRNSTEAALVECSAGSTALFVAANENNWMIKSTTTYKDLGIKDSVALALLAILNPKSINKRKMSYFFPAKGDTVQKREDWLAEILKNGKSDLNVVVSEKNGNYFGFSPFASSSGKFLSNVNANYGVSVSSKDLPVFLHLNPDERGNGQRIVGE
jgi:hypothetical protein